MNKIEKILDNTSKSKYGVDFTKERGRIYYRTDIIKAMKEFGEICFDAGAETYCDDWDVDQFKYKTYKDFLKEIEDVV